MKLSAAPLSIILATLIKNGNAICPANDEEPLKIVHIGNSYTGGTSVGRACDEPAPSDCQLLAVPGNVAGFHKGDTYPGLWDFPPDQDTCVDASQPYNAETNPHRGDVPSKIRLLAEYICSGNAIEYVQNSQSAFSTRVHARQSQKNPQDGTLHLLSSFAHDIVIVQPQWMEYLDVATDTRISALQELLRPRGVASPGARYFVQQTWPKRESTVYNQICTTSGKDGKKKGIIEEVNKTLQGLAEAVLTPFNVVPTGDAFVHFAELACGTGILGQQSRGKKRSTACAFDDSHYCPMWWGETGKISLFHEEVDIPGTHQSEEIGAWLSASVLYGIFQSTDACYVSEEDLMSVMPPIPSDVLADIPSGKSIHSIISEAARLALSDKYGGDIPVCSK